MERVNRILANETFKENMLHLQRLEKDRQYCRHGIDHLLDVARLAYIEDLEKGLAIEKEIIYGTALLHDLGRVLEYTKQIPHNEASVQLAKEILPECGFNNEEVKRICGAIAAHRCCHRRAVCHRWERWLCSGILAGQYRRCVHGQCYP